MYSLVLTYGLVALGMERKESVKTLHKGKLICFGDDLKEEAEILPLKNAGFCSWRQIILTLEDFL